MENISTKEIWLGVAVFFVSIALYFLLMGAVENSYLSHLKKYETALLIQDERTFLYADQTNVGNVLAYGQMNGSGATFPEITQPYSTIEKITERYTQHSRQVCNSYDDDGTCTSYRTEYYYTWDYQRKDIVFSSTYQYLGVVFLPNQITHPDTLRLKLSQDTVISSQVDKIYYNYIYEDSWIWESVGDKRYYYKYLPKTYNASMFIGFYGENTVGTLYYEMTPEQVLTHLERQKTITQVILFIAIVLLAIITYFWIANDFLEIE